MEKVLDIDSKIEKLINQFIKDPVRTHGTGEGSSTQSLRTVILPDGRILDVQLRITTFKKEINILNS